MTIEGIILVLMVAVTVEALVEYSRTVIDTFKSGNKHAVWLQGAAVLVAVGICLLTGADLYSTLGVTFRFEIAGQILTGIFAARGANFVSDFTGELRDLFTSRTE